jgi:nucleoside phosphorylase
MPPPRALSKDEYTVGWICALPFEMAAAVVMLDEIHEDLQEHDPSDHNSYKLGAIQNHNIVIACLPAGIYGNNPAATVSKDMLRTFMYIRFGLLVGIGGGAPSQANDIRLGDIVVSQPSGTSGGVIQYDRGKTVQEGDFRRTGSLNSPPFMLLTALGRMQAEYEYRSSKIPMYISEIIEKYPKLRNSYTYQGATNDRLYQAGYEHPPAATTCELCDSSQEVMRDPRDDTEPRIFYGNIASGNQVIKNGATRERLQKDLDVLCFEMEAAGLISNFPCLVIRGICDYSDSHKNKSWQRYAAAVAAAFTKEFLHFVSAHQVRQEKPIVQVSGG